MRINTNLAAMNAWRNMTANNENMQKSLEKLSSGYRINRAADDAAGLAVSEKMRAQIKGTNMAVRNSQDGVSMMQTAEGGLNETHAILQRMRELAVQSSTATLQDTDRSLLQEEFSQLQNEVTRIGNATQFNGKNLLDGSAGVVGTATDTSKVTNITGTADTTAGTLSITASTMAVAATDSSTATFAGLGTALGASSTISINGKAYAFVTADTIATVLNTINADQTTHNVTASLTSNAITLTSNVVGSGGQLVLANVTGSFGGLATATGTDAALTITGGPAYTAKGNHITIMNGSEKGLEFDLTATGAVDINVSTNGSMSIQTGSNSGQTLSISINDMRASALGIAAAGVGTQSNANAAVSLIDTAIQTVSTQRAKLGALSNRLEHTVNSLQASSENLSAAESRIRDVDMASEMANFTKYQILQQASTAMLAQANQSTQGVLSLLR